MDRYTYNDSSAQPSRRTAYTSEHENVGIGERSGECGSAPCGVCKGDHLVGTTNSCP